jgi:hypothetical protein
MTVMTDLGRLGTPHAPGDYRLSRAHSGRCAQNVFNLTIGSDSTDAVTDVRELPCVCKDQTIPWTMVRRGRPDAMDVIVKPDGAGAVAFHCNRCAVFEIGLTPERASQLRRDHTL